MSTQPRRGLVAFAVAGWLAAVVVATAVTIGAVSLIGLGLFGGSTRTLSEAEVADALAAATPPVATPATVPSPTATTTSPSSPTPTLPPPPPVTPSPGPATPTPAAPSAFSRAGNVVLARCIGDLAVIVSWSPAQGYRVEDGVNQHGNEAEVEFESADDDVRIRVACVDGRPAAAIEGD